jgi:ribosomal protein L11 methyltransferase
MKADYLWRVSVRTSAEAEEAVQQLLERLCGLPAATHTDAETGALTVMAFGEKRRHQRRSLRTLVRAGLEHIRACGLDPAPARISVRRLPREDWAESWKRHFKPVVIAPELVIQPSWSRRRPRAGQTVVVLDPGLSFGTGQHPTTAFCLGQIVRARRLGLGTSLMDLGCGSGILAIAAAALGYSRVHGLDFDPDAVRIARHNAAQNGVAVRFLRQDVSRLPRRNPRRYDVVCANLTYDLLLAHRPRILGQMGPRGLLVLAGILDHQFPAVQAAYEQAGWRLDDASTSGEWRSGAFRTQNV